MLIFFKYLKIFGILLSLLVLLNNCVYLLKRALCDSALWKNLSIVFSLISFLEFEDFDCAISEILFVHLGPDVKGFCIQFNF